MLQNPLAQILGIVPPRPKFELFQPVRSHYDYEDCRVLSDTGIVIGLFYSLGMNEYGYQTGWLYIVYWQTMPSSPHLPLPYVEHSFECDLVAIEQT